MNFITKYRILATLAIVLSVVLLGLVSVLLYSYTSHKPGCPNSRRPLSSCEKKSDDHFAKMLKLDSKQSTIFLSEKKLFQQKHDSLGTIIRNISKEIIEEVVAENPDQNKIDELVQRFGELEKEQKVVLINHINALNDFLNPEQREILIRRLFKMEENRAVSPPTPHRMRNENEKCCKN